MKSQAFGEAIAVDILLDTEPVGQGVPHYLHRAGAQAYQRHACDEERWQRQPIALAFANQP